MKIATIISVILDDEFAEKLEKICRPNIPKGYEEYYHEGTQYPFEPGSLELQEAIKLLEEADEDYRLFRNVLYSKKELESIEYYTFVDPDPLELEGKTSLSYGTQYYHGELTGDVLIDRKFFKKSKWAVALPFRIVSEDVKQIIEDNNLTGISFTPNVKDYKGREMSQFYLVHIENRLPEVNKSTWLTELGDTLYLESELQYERKKLVGALDFNLTSERLNNDRIPYVVVSSRVKKVFKENGIRLHFEPVTLLD